MQNKIIIAGKGLNGGYARVEISPAEKFIFHQHNNGKKNVVSLKPDNIFVENHTIVIGPKKEIKVVEHFFSALYGLNIFNVKIDLFGNELPFFDGSSLDFVKSLIEYRLNKDIKTVKLDREIFVQEGESFIHYEPLDKGLFIDMELTHPFIQKQHIGLNINQENYIKKIAPARTFVFTDESDPRLKDLPPYGIGITEKGIYCNEPLRFPDEPVRHKILDLLGDLYFLQKRLSGKIKACNTFHRLNLKFLARILTTYNSHNRKI